MPRRATAAPAAATPVPAIVKAFVVGETHGVWGKAETVPGIKALNKGGIAGINSLSCGAPGNCGAGGEYLNTSGRFQGFVVSES